MKKIRFLTIAVIILSVVALGIFMGKQTFKVFEAQSMPGKSLNDQTASTSTQVLSGPNIKSQLLYTTSTMTHALPEQGPVSSEVAQLAIADASPTAGNLNDSVKLKFIPGGDKWIAYANGDGINVREGPTTNTKAMMKVSKGTKGTVLEREAGWTKIKWDFNKKIGWVRDDLLVLGPETVLAPIVTKSGGVEGIASGSIDEASAKIIKAAQKLSVGIAKPAPASETVRGLIAADKLPAQAVIEAQTMANVRSGPSTSHSRVGRLPRGVVVQIKSMKNMGRYNWFEIIFNDGKKQGWTREDNLKF